MIGKLPKLRELSLTGCNLSDHFILSLSPSKFNFSTSFSVFDLSGNTFTSFKIFQWVSNVTSNLVELDLRANHLEGFTSDHSEIAMNSLERLDLSDNGLKGWDLKLFMNVCNLHSLNMRENDFTGNLESLLHNLSGGCVRHSLQELDLSFNQITGTLPDLSLFPSLKALDLSRNQLSGRIPEGSSLPSQLESLRILLNSLEGGIPKSFGSICTLRLLHLFGNNLNEEFPTILHQLSGCARNSLQELDLGRNQINGTLPDLSMFSALKTLDLFENRLNGKILESSRLPSKLESLSIGSNFLKGGVPKSFGNTCTLRSLRMSDNNLSEELSVIIHNLSGCTRYSLEELYLDNNQINGTLPDLSVFPSLIVLNLSENRLNWQIPKDIRFPPQLERLCISSNSLEGLIIESHFTNMSNLRKLDLSDNSLALEFSQKWNPSFRLWSIRLRSCKLGPTFPEWLQTQNHIHYLDISNAGISDIVPHWFWAKIIFSTVNISYNNLKGIIPNLPMRNTRSLLTLASNQLEGPIPPFLRSFASLDLSKNKFSDSLSFLCANGTVVEALRLLDLSHNQLSGLIPDCWSNFKSLQILDLSHNDFSGKIPNSLGFLLELRVLVLRNNSLTEIPPSLKSCTELLMLDAAENELSGPIPSWIGNELRKLQYLTLGRNLFSGSLPVQLCHLQSILLLDLSLNNLHGRIPKCFKNFTLPTYKGSLWASYDLNALLMWKGAEQIFKNDELTLLKSIDLSSNHFSGEIPAELESLLELVSLNLSRNNLTGGIPSNIGQLTSLEFLDLSRNQLFGSIPSSLVQIDRLTMLDLSHNHLSGMIPTGTQLQSFNATSYEDNLDLCGPPLAKLCIGGQPPQEAIVKSQEEDEDSLVTSGFYISMAFGFVIGFWGVFGSMLLKRSWRHACFNFLNTSWDTIYVMIVVKVARFKSWLRR